MFACVAAEADGRFEPMPIYVCKVYCGTRNPWEFGFDRPPTGLLRGGTWEPMWGVSWIDGERYAVVFLTAERGWFVSWQSEESPRSASWLPFLRCARATLGVASGTIEPMSAEQLARVHANPVDGPTLQ